MCLLTRKQFRESVFNRDKYKCVICGAPAVDAHHILDRKLFTDGGYYIDNGVSLCSTCHIKAENSIISCEQLRLAANISSTIIPVNFDPENSYDKWGNMLTGRVKYPKTLHFPWSPNLQNDDRVLENVDCFQGKYVIVTEKMDGENTTLYKEGIHARSILDMAKHPSRTWVQSLHGRIKHDIPDGWRICGENVYAKHSIHYRNLESYFYVFSIWDSGDMCLDWYQTEVWCNLLGLIPVPTIWHGKYDEDTVKDVANYYMFLTPHPQPVEGYVVRNWNQFHLDDFQTNVAKYVRKGHVQTSEHWLNEPLVKNELILQSIKEEER